MIDALHLRAQGFRRDSQRRELARHRCRRLPLYDTCDERILSLPADSRYVPAYESKSSRHSFRRRPELYNTGSLKKTLVFHTLNEIVRYDGIELSAFPTFYFLKGLFKAYWSTIRAKGSHGIERIGNSNDARLQRDCGSSQTIWVPVAIVTFMVMKDNLSKDFEPFTRMKNLESIR